MKCATLCLKYDMCDTVQAILQHCVCNSVTDIWNVQSYDWNKMCATLTKKLCAEHCDSDLTCATLWLKNYVCNTQTETRWLQQYIVEQQ